MANQDLFKEAIAEAKAVREAAIANAREALEESLTPHLKSMLAARLQELENEEVEEVISEEEVEEEAVEEAKKDDEMEEAKHEDEDAMEEAQGNIDAHEENPHDQLEEEDEAVAEAEKEEAEDDSEKSEDEAEEEAEEEKAEEDDVEVKDMEVEDLKALIRDIIAQEMGGESEEAEMELDVEAQPEDMVAAEDEEINLEELLAELENDLQEEEVAEEEVTEEVNPLQAELDQALATIEELRSNLSEVNLLNAKLLYLNKIFRANNLTEAQKVSTVAAFDKATSAKEVKLVYETLKEGFVTKKESIKENKGFASKAAGVAPNKEVIQVSEQVLRMQKLAGIIR